MFFISDFDKAVIVVKQINSRDLPVRPHGDIARHILAPQHHGQHIVRADDVVTRRRHTAGKVIRLESDDQIDAFFADL